MIFLNRAEAGRRLAARLKEFANRDDVVVLGVARGGVPVAFEVAAALMAPLDVFVLRKLGVPEHEELAFGAIASGGTRVLDKEVIEELGISDLEIELVTAQETKEVQRRESTYRGGRSPLPLAGQIVILVDDGIATGSGMRAAVAALRQLNPARIIIAVPVAPLSTYLRLEREGYDLVCVHVPESFFAIGQFYRNFSQVSDKEVMDLLHRTARPALRKAV